MPAERKVGGKVRILAVYIEYVLLDNIIIDYLLLKYTFLLVRGESGFWRLLFCSFLGAAFAAAMPLLSLPQYFAIPIKIIFSMALVFAAGKFRTKKNYLLSLVAFNLYTFLLGGSVTGIFNLFHLPLDREYSVGLIVLAAYLLIKLAHKGVTLLYRRKNICACISDCEIELNGQKVKTKGFLDTGNNLYDTESNLPVVVCSKSVAFALTDGFKNKIPGKYIKISTAVGADKMLVFKIDKLKIYNKDKVNIFDNVLLGVTRRAFAEGGYDLILHSEFIGGLLC